MLVSSEHPWRSVNFSKVASFKRATLLKLTLLHRCFSRFSNCTNSTKSHNASLISKRWLKRFCKLQTHVTFTFKLIFTFLHLHCNPQLRTLLHTFFCHFNVTDVSNQLDKSLVVISLNFFKAFDRVDWDFIFSLRKFGYRQKFIHMIEAVYANIPSKVIKSCNTQNGERTKYPVSQV